MNDFDVFSNIDNRIKQYGYSYIATGIDETSMTYTVGLSDCNLLIGFDVRKCFQCSAGKS